MPNEEKTHTKGEVDILISLARVETMQCMTADSFNEHKKEDTEQFERIYKSLEHIDEDVNKIPERMLQCKEKLKTEVLVQSRSEFTTITNFEIFKTKIITWGMAVGIIAGIVAKLIDWVLKLTGVQ